MENNVKQNAGFTFLEILIVIIILGIIATIFLPKLNTNTDDAKVSAASFTLKIIQHKIDEYKARNGTYPSKIESSWFASNMMPVNPYDPGAEVTVRVSSTNNTAKIHPKNKTVEGEHYKGVFWYNPTNGIIRVRVAALSTNSEIIALYNRVNGTNVTSVNQTGW